MLTIDQIIGNLEIMRDNSVARASLIVPDDIMRMLHTGTNPNVNHDPAIDARMADDLRKMVSYHANFRRACVEFSVQRYLPHSVEDPERFRRTRRQMIETGRDIEGCLSHIEPAIYR